MMSGKRLISHLYYISIDFISMELYRIRGIKIDICIMCSIVDQVVDLLVDLSLPG